ncbi:class I SAM-dependent methyltransferase [Komagataeibacter rhaeticus]|nr:class I SAM-dependent methyltransferase [Komagataeibacter rhaeticus]
MSQNIYDQPDFFHGYSQLPRSRAGLDAAAEWPAMQALLPPLARARIVDLGCGFGWFCRWASARHAGSVLGIDLSENMLARARGFGHDAAITYARQDLETLDLPAAAFDLAYSSLALHYIRDLAPCSAPFTQGWYRAGISCFLPNTRSIPPRPGPTGYRMPRAPVSGRSMTTRSKVPAARTGWRRA